MLFNLLENCTHKKCIHDFGKYKMIIILKKHCFLAYSGNGAAFRTNLSMVNFQIFYIHLPSYLLYEYESICFTYFFGKTNVTARDGIFFG